jgi:hypothetical protein
MRAECAASFTFDGERAASRTLVAEDGTAVADRQGRDLRR